MSDHRMHENSLTAWVEIEDARTERAEAVYTVLRAQNVPMTDREVMRALGFVDPNAVRPRITELKDQRWVVEHGRVVDPETGKTVRTVRSLTPAERTALIADERAAWERDRAERARILAEEEKARRPAEPTMLGVQLSMF